MHKSLVIANEIFSDFLGGPRRNRTGPRIRNLSAAELAKIYFQKTLGVLFEVMYLVVALHQVDHCRSLTCLALSRAIPV